MTRKTKDRSQSVTGDDLVVHRLPQSGVAEAYRSIKTKLLFSSPDKELKSILVTSTHAGEGKTFSSISLALVMAQAGKKVLLIEADLRRPRLHRIFSLGSRAESIGLTSLIMRRTGLQDTAIETGVENFSVMPAGPVPPNPAELLGSASMGDVLSSLRATFDFIILDTPPVLGLPDTLSLASKVDGVVLVIQSYKASYKSVLRAREAIEMVNGRILGAILNKVRPEPFGYYYGGYHGYYHGYYYHRYGKEVEEPGQPEGTRTRETEK
ncbi:MAG TPA: CpsD/CapB family tyrosine-protein kinase [Candidatus Tripitaka sp. YC43]